MDVLGLCTWTEIAQLGAMASCGGCSVAPGCVAYENIARSTEIRVCVRSPGLGGSEIWCDRSSGAWH